MSDAKPSNFPAMIDDRSFADLEPPGWVRTLFEPLGSLNGELRSVGSPSFALISTTVPDAVKMSAEQLERAIHEAYRRVHRAADAGPARYPVRLWNYVAQINEPMGGGLDRYMVFNAGRYKAFLDWFGSSHRFDKEVATASAVGHFGNDVVIHCLCAHEPGVAKGNPRQISPHRYSKRFGPLPPCFVRATILPSNGGGSRKVLVGGTASIRGEESVNVGNLAAQLTETFENLSAIMGDAAAGSNNLSAYRHLRVYYPRLPDRPAVLKAVTAAFPLLQSLELIHAQLCRPELLVEIEGVAEETR